MSRKCRLAPHIGALVKRYLADKPFLFDEYLNIAWRYCPTGRHIIKFI